MSTEKRTLHHTDLTVSRFCFGTMTLGKPLDQSGTNEVIQRCLDAGINFFDTANLYNAGVAEAMLGKALKGQRNKVVIASKVFYKVGDAGDHGFTSPAGQGAIPSVVEFLRMGSRPDALARPAAQLARALYLSADV